MKGNLGLVFVYLVCGALSESVRSSLFALRTRQSRQSTDHVHHHAHAPPPTPSELASPLQLPVASANQSFCVLPDSRLLQCQAVLGGNFTCSPTGATGAPPILGFETSTFPFTRPHPSGAVPGPVLPTVPGFHFEVVPGARGVGHVNYSFSFSLPIQHSAVGMPSAVGIPGVTTAPPFSTAAPMFPPRIPEATVPFPTMPTPAPGLPTAGVTVQPITTTQVTRLPMPEIVQVTRFPIPDIALRPEETTRTPVVPEVTITTTLRPEGIPGLPAATLRPEEVTGVPTSTLQPEATQQPQETTPRPTGRPVIMPSLGIARPVDATPPPGFSAEKQQQALVKIGESPALAGTTGGFGYNVTLGPTGFNRTLVDGKASFGEVQTIVRDPSLPACAYLLQTRVPDQQYCDRYHVCTRSGLVGEFCPDGLVFDVEREECHLPGSVNCTGRPLRQTPQRVGPCPRRNGVFPIEGSCTKFLICSNGTYGVVECPAGLAFSFSLGACEWPDVAGVPGCLSEQLFNFTCPPVSPERGFLRVANPRDCRSYYVCLPGGAARLLSCPGGTVFSPVNAVCDAPHRVPGCETYYGIPGPPTSPVGGAAMPSGSQMGGTISGQGIPITGQAPAVSTAGSPGRFGGGRS